LFFAFLWRNFYGEKTREEESPSKEENDREETSGQEMLWRCEEEMRREENSQEIIFRGQKKWKVLRHGGIFHFFVFTLGDGIDGGCFSIAVDRYGCKFE
jgi:hypothetical protein